ncbi:MAG TPA: metalloregulator ArsR/SmtB family transcription factor [Roseiflexaceae bacterium]|nr:metalloregulator ArsR/SmtB family transcription factor [Roseiflexaceae bacterium]HMP42475.1 metalloregulator ArsR/SmtB family transcription factor [Roseiflexaceae bacterium]
MNRSAKTELFERLAQVAHAIANPHRLELLDLLVQAPRSVEQLAVASAMSLANASQHLQRLKRTGLVVGARRGTTIRYRLADPAVARLWMQLREVAVSQLADVERALDQYRPQRQQFPTITPAALQAKMARGEMLLLDVRPAEEFAAGHLPGALSLPLEELPMRLAELPATALIVTYCRGPLCVYADEALAQVIASGRRGVRLEEGVAEWQVAGYMLEHGERS